MIRSQTSNKKQSGAILMIAMIMIAIMTSIGTSTLAKVMAETKSVRAGRKLLANDRPDNFNTLATIVSNKQRVFGEVADAPYLKPKVLDFVSIGNTRLTLNGLPVIYQMPNITRITCPSNQTVSVPIAGSACPEYYQDRLNNYQEIFSENWETSSVTGSVSVFNDAKAGAISAGVFDSDGNFVVVDYERLIMLTIMVYDKTSSQYSFVYNNSSIFIPKGLNFADENPGEAERLRNYLFDRVSDGSQYVRVELKVFTGSIYEPENTFCVDKSYSDGDSVGVACPPECYQGVDSPVCSNSYDVSCLEVSNTLYTDVFNLQRQYSNEGGSTKPVTADARFIRATELDNACIRWDSAIIACSVNNLNYNDPYVIPQADRYIFTNLVDYNIFTVHNNTDGMSIPLPAAQRDTCTSFPDHEDIAVKLFMGALYDKNLADSDKSVLGVPNIDSNLEVENIQPQEYWVNFIDSSHELLINNSKVQELKSNEVLGSLINDLDAPWIKLEAVFDKIKIGWASADSSQIVLTQFFNSSLELLAERKTSDPDCDDGSCIYEWNCNGSEIVSFDYWYTRIPAISLAGQRDPATTDIGYYISGIGNVKCDNGNVISEVKPNPSGRAYLSEDKKATWTRDSGPPLDEIGPRLKGIAGTDGCIFDYAIFVPYDGTNIRMCVQPGRRFTVDINYCVNTQGRDYGGGIFHQHSEQKKRRNENISDIHGVMCPGDSYIKEFKWYPKQGWMSANYSDMGVVKDIRCSDGTTLHKETRTYYGGVKGVQGNLGNLTSCGGGSQITCPTSGNDYDFMIWCDGEPLPPYDATETCFDRGFGKETSADIRAGAESGETMRDSRGGTCPNY